MAALLMSILVVVVASLAASSVAQSPSGYRSALTHVDSKGAFTKSELLRRAAHRSRLRAATMLSGYSSTTSSSSTARPRLQSGQAEYLMDLAIGTPPVPFVALADTGSDLIWTQCQPCKLCFPQDTPIYNTSASSSFAPEPCSSAMCWSLPSHTHNCTRDSLQCTYYYEYADSAYSAGVLGRETLTLGSVAAGGVAFGCGSDNGGDSCNSTGTVGLGRGPLSLVAQLGFGKFSYCLTDFFQPSLSSPVLFGSVAELAPRGGSGTVQTTPLVQNLVYPSWYYVSLQGISLGDTRLPIPEQAFQLHDDGTGGMVVDSGTTFTILEGRAFRVVLDHVAEVLGQPAVNTSSFDTPCFPAPSGQRQLPAMPDMVLHFAGGADMRLHRDNYMSFDEEESAFCLNMVGDDGALPVSILGNFQQQNIQMLFDITVGQLSFAPADCSKL